MPAQRMVAQLPETFLQRRRLEVCGEHATSLRRERSSPQQVTQQGILARPGQLPLHQIGRETAVVDLQSATLVVLVPDPRPEQDHVADLELLAARQAVMDAFAARDE